MSEVTFPGYGVGGAPEGANESPGLLDLGKKVISDTLALGAGASASAQAAAANVPNTEDGRPGAPNAHDFARGMNRLFNYFKSKVDDSMSPGAKDALENSRNHLAGAAVLNFMGVIPQGAVLLGAHALGGPAGVAAAGAAVQVGQDIDAALNRFNRMDDAELQKTSGAYREMRTRGMSEQEARISLTNALYDRRQLGTSAAIGGAQFAAAQRFIPGASQSVGRNARALAIDTGVNAAAGAASGGSTNASAQIANQRAQTGEAFSFDSFMDDFIKGGILGGALGLAGSGAHYAAHRMTRERPGDNQRDVPADQQAALAARQPEKPEPKPDAPIAGQAPAPEPALAAPAGEQTPASAAAAPAPPNVQPAAPTAADAVVTPPVTRRSNRRTKAVETAPTDAVPADQQAALAARQPDKPAETPAAPEAAPADPTAVPPDVAEATDRTRRQAITLDNVRPEDIMEGPAVPDPVAEATRRVQEGWTDPQQPGRPEPTPDTATATVPDPVGDAVRRVQERWIEPEAAPATADPRPPTMETAPAATRPFDDTGRTAPEPAVMLGYQVQKVVDGDVAAALVPKNTPMPPELLARAKEQGLSLVPTKKGIYIIDPTRLKMKDVYAAIKEGRDGELLGLGPVNKQEVAARIADGETPVGVVERTPDGIEVKAAAGTDQTAGVQRAALEANKTPGNTVAVEPPAKVIEGRRVLVDAEQAKKEAAETARRDRQIAKSNEASDRSAQGVPEKAASIANPDARRKFYRDANKEIAKAEKEGRQPADWARLAKNIQEQQARTPGARLDKAAMALLQRAHENQVETAAAAKAQPNTEPKRDGGKVAVRAKKKAEQEAARAAESREAEIARLVAEQKADAKSKTVTGLGGNAMERSADQDAKTPGKGASEGEYDAGLPYHSRVDLDEALHVVDDRPARYADDGDTVLGDIDADRKAAEDRVAARRAEGPPPKVTPESNTAAPKVERLPSRKIGVKGQEAIARARELAAKRKFDAQLDVISAKDALAEARAARRARIAEKADDARRAETEARVKDEAARVIERARVEEARAAGRKAVEDALGQDPAFRAEMEAAKAAENAFNRTRSESVTVGKSMSDDLGGYARELKELVNFPGRVLVLHPEDLKGNNATKIAESLGLTPREYADVVVTARAAYPNLTSDVDALGGAIRSGSDVNVIVLKKGMSRAQSIETVGHELGHLVMHRVFNEMAAKDPALKTQIMDAYTRWLANATTKTAYGHIRSLRALKSAREAIKKNHGNEDLAAVDMSDRSYWFGFNEFFADSMARWAQTSEQPMTVMDRFFSRIAQAYRKIVSKLTGKEHLPEPELKAFFDRLVKDNPIKPEDITLPNVMSDGAEAMLSTVRRDMTMSAGDWRKTVGRSWRKFKDSVSTNMMLGERAIEAFKGSEAPRLVAEGIERLRVAADTHLNRDGGGNDVTRTLADLERKYVSDGQWAKAVDVAHDATVYNVNPFGDNTHLGKDKMAGWQSKSRLADIESRLAALPDDLQAGIRKAEAFFRSEQDAMALAQVENILRIAGIDEPGLAKRIHEDGLTPEEKAGTDPKIKNMALVTSLSNARELKKIDGWYLPLRRRGEFVVTGTRKITAPDGAMLVEDKSGRTAIRFAMGSDAKSRRAAEAYVSRPDADLHIDTKITWVDKADPKKVLDAEDPNAVPAYDVYVQTQHTEFHTSMGAAERAAAELAADGMEMQGIREHKDYEGGDRRLLSSEMATIVKSMEQRDRFRNMTQAQKNEVIQSLAQASLRLSGGRLASSRLPRRRVTGYSSDMVRNTAEFAVSSANFIAGQKHRPEIDANLAAMRKVIEDYKNAKDDGTALRRDEIYTTMEARANADTQIAPTAANTAIRRMLQLSHLDKLAGVSYHVINSAEPWTTSLPVIGGRHGAGATSKTLVGAYDLIGAKSGLMAGFKDTLSAYRNSSGFTDYVKTFSAEIARNTDAGEAGRLGTLLQHLHDRGLFERESGMEVAFQSRPDAWAPSRALDRADLMSRQVGAAVEAINRSVTAVAAYRLEFAKTKDHNASLKYATEVVHDTMGNYSSSNAAPIFQHPLGRVALQFKKFGQKTYYLLGKTMRKSLQGDREAMRQFAGLMMTHGMVAGALGLPLEPVKIALIAANALGATTFSYDDFENMIRRGAAGLLGTTGGELATRGLVRAIGVDVANRMSLSSLVTMGQPNSEKRRDIMAWLGETAMGAPVGTIIQQVEGVQALFRQDVVAAADKMIPLKAARDVQRSVFGAMGGKTDRMGRQIVEPYTPYQAAVRALGFAPAAEAERQEHRRAFSEANRSEQRVRSELTAAYIKATPGERMRIWGQVERYNRELPVGAQAARITRQQLDRAVMTRQRETRDETVVGGMRTNRRNQHIYDRNDVYNDQ